MSATKASITSFPGSNLRRALSPYEKVKPVLLRFADHVSRAHISQANRRGELWEGVHGPLARNNRRSQGTFSFLQITTVHVTFD